MNTTYRPKVWKPVAFNTKKPEDEDITQIAAVSLKPFFTLDVVSTASGSCYYESGLSKVIAAVFGPKTNSTNEYSEDGTLACDVSYASFLRNETGYSRSPQEVTLSIALKDVLTSSIQLNKFPKLQLNIFVLILEQGADELSSVINAASLALVNSSIELFDMNISATIVDTSTDLILQPSRKQFSDAKSKVVISYLPSLRQITHFNQEGRSSPSRLNTVTKELLIECDRLHQYFREEISVNLVTSFVIPPEWNEYIMNTINYSKKLDTNTQDS